MYVTCCYGNCHALLINLQDLLMRVEQAVDKFLFWDEEVTICEAVTSVRLNTCTCIFYMYMYNVHVQYYKYMYMYMYNITSLCTCTCT